MFASKSFCFYLFLIFVAVPQVVSSAQMNKTSSDGKIFITGDHNEVVVSTDRETKIALAEIKSELQSMSQRLKTLENKVAADYALLFPRKGTTDYVITRGMPSLTAVTFCFWMKTADTGNGGVPLSYAVSGSDNELLLYDYSDFYLTVGSASLVRTYVSANDGKWHHICVTWKNTAGSWNLFKDGKVAASRKGLKTGHVIRGGGALVLGQEQDSVGGGFVASDSFIGEMTGVNIWDHVISDREITHMSQSCLTGVGNVFQWRDFKDHVKGSVNIIHPSC